RDGLRQYHYVEGENIVVEWRLSGRTTEELHHLATALVALDVAVSVAVGPAVAPAIAATRTIPIVFLNSRDPVGAGYVASLSRPGGNVTGLKSFGEQLSAKAVELLKESAPGVTYLAVFWSGTGPRGAWEQT